MSRANWDFRDIGNSSCIPEGRCRTHTEFQTATPGRTCIRQSFSASFFFFFLLRLIPFCNRLMPSRKFPSLTCFISILQERVICSGLTLTLRTRRSRAAAKWRVWRIVICSASCLKVDVEGIQCGQLAIKYLYTCSFILLCIYMYSLSENSILIIL